MLHINLYNTAKQIRYVKIKPFKVVRRFFQTFEEPAKLSATQYVFIQQRSCTSDSSTKGNQPQILSKLFPQTAPENVKENPKQENKEDEKTKEQSKKKMNFMFGIFGGVATAMGIWAIYEFGRPEIDSNGKIIEDEFSKEPIIQQYFKRMWKSMTYYQKNDTRTIKRKITSRSIKTTIYTTAIYTCFRNERCFSPS